MNERTTTLVLCRWLISGVILVLANTTQAQTTYRVSTSGSTTYPFDTWAKAASTIQAAVDVASDGDTVLITNGTYLGINTEVVIITNGITVTSANGADVTIVDGENVLGRRVFVLTTTASNAVVDNLTITRGNGGTSNPGAGVGGGLYIEGGTVQNCMITNN